MTAPLYDAVVVVSFGGPEGPDDVLPFLENVLRGKPVPQQRMLEVAEHYHHFGGVSPLNEQNRALIRALRAEMDAHGVDVPIYWGNRNWHPLLADTVRQMADEGITRALALVTSAFSSYSGCRQYLEDIDRARAEVGASAPVIDKIHSFFNHPGFVAAVVDRTRRALDEIPDDRRAEAPILFTAHSIPQAMSDDCNYVAQLTDIAGLVADALNHTRWQLVYQSRSGPPQQPWLEPDVCDALEALPRTAAARDVVIMPLGFLSDHLEVIFDLDTEAAELCQRLDLNMVRAATVGCHPRFVTACREMIQERLDTGDQRPAVGNFAARPDVCPSDCCPPGRK